jgi:hypothetical protein
MKKVITMFSAAVLVCTVCAGSVFAFTDLAASEKEPIMMLKDRGVVTGVDSEHFAPQSPVSYAQTVSMIVKGLGLNIDHIRFFKKPEASDYFTNVPNDAWYAEAFIIANLNGLNIAKDVDPNRTITREQLADLLIHGLDKKGTFPVVMMYISFEDEDQIDKSYVNSLQRLYLHKIATLDGTNKAYPKREATRGEAAVLLSNTLRFIETHSGTNTPLPPQQQQQEVKITVEKVNADVNKIVLTSTLPNAGYSLSISGIRFQSNGTAVIQYVISEPKPGEVYPMMVKEAHAETYMPSTYTATAEQQFQ